MKIRYKRWKKWFLIPLLCVLLVMAGGCGKGSADSTQKEEEQELHLIEAAADNPAQDGFDDQQVRTRTERSTSTVYIRLWRTWPSISTPTESFL